MKKSIVTIKTLEEFVNSNRIQFVENKITLIGGQYCFSSDMFYLLGRKVELHDGIFIDKESGEKFVVREWMCSSWFDLDEELEYNELELVEVRDNDMKPWRLARYIGTNWNSPHPYKVTFDDIALCKHNDKAPNMLGFKQIRKFENSIDETQ